MIQITMYGGTQACVMPLWAGCRSWKALNTEQVWSLSTGSTNIFSNLTDGYRVLLSSQTVKPSNPLHLVPRLRMTGALPPNVFMVLCLGKGTLHFFWLTVHEDRLVETNNTYRILVLGNLLEAISWMEDIGNRTITLRWI